MASIYFDNAATTPLDPEVLDAMLPYMREHHGNPSAIHGYGRVARAGIERARRQVAELLNCTPGEIVFTSCGTEADNLALIGAVRDLGRKNVISSPTEHHAVEYAVRAVQQAGSAGVYWVKPDAQGKPDTADLKHALVTLPDAVVSLMHANNELGARIDLQRTGDLCREHGAIFHSDTVQTMGHYRFDLEKLPVDFLTASAHKFHGPKGIGFLYMRNGCTLKPQLLGGAQERNMRAGTENIYGIVGLAKALEIAYRDLDGHAAHVQSLKARMKKGILELVPGSTVNGDPSTDALYTVLNVHFPDDGRGEMLLYNLDIEGVACSGGSACSSGSNKGSHVIDAVYPGRTGANIRFSFSRFNTEQEVDAALRILARITEPAAVRL